MPHPIAPDTMAQASTPSIVCATAACTEFMGPTSGFKCGTEAEMALAFSIASITDRKSTRLNSSHVEISYAVFCLKKKKKKNKNKQNTKKDTYNEKQIAKR